MDRRYFVKSASAVAGMLAINPFGCTAGVKAGNKSISDKVMMGKTGIQVSRMAMGTGTNGIGKASNQTRQLGIKGLSDLLLTAYDHGVFFWETADQYGSHPHLKEALKHVPREKVVVMTKTHASTEEEMKNDLERFMRELGTDYIDIILLHCMIDKDWPVKKQGAMNFLSQAKENKLIRAHGVSVHSFEALQSSAATPWVQINLTRLNPGGVIMDADVPTVTAICKQMNQAGKAIMGMKILGAGQLADRKDECLRFALAQEYMSCFTLGIESLDQFLDIEKRVSEYA
jgi:predicted aldo/keto reductase-like oxidoreductase